MEQRLTEMATLEEENREGQNTQCKLKADNSLLLSKVERLELENQRLKKELERSENMKLDELKGKYDVMK